MPAPALADTNADAAQAVAARSYALAVRKTNQSFPARQLTPLMPANQMPFDSSRLKYVVSSV